MAKKKTVNQKRRIAIIKALAQFKLRENLSLKDIDVILEKVNDEIDDLIDEPEFARIRATYEEVTEVIKGLLIDIFKLAQTSLEETDI